MPSLGIGDSWDSVSAMNTPANVKLLIEQMEEAVGAATSMVVGYIEHPFYQRLVTMGMPVVPTLLSFLEEHSLPLLCALEDITGECPFPASDYGRVSKMVQAWLDWGKTRYSHH